MLYCLVTKDKQLYCITGQHRVEDMRVRCVPRVDISDDQMDESSKAKTENMGLEELELDMLILWEMRKNTQKVIAEKSGNAEGGLLRLCCHHGSLPRQLLVMTVVQQLIEMDVRGNWRRKGGPFLLYEQTLFMYQFNEIM